MMPTSIPQPLVRPGEPQGEGNSAARGLTVWAKKKEILTCSFEEADRESDYPLRGFVPPEMVKTRPIVVLSTVTPRLFTVIPLSTTEPQPLKSFHYELVWDMPLPGWESFSLCWAKGDMIYAVSQARLRFLRTSYNRSTRKAKPIRRFLSEGQWEGVRAAVREALKL